MRIHWESGHTLAPAWARRPGRSVCAAPRVHGLFFAETWYCEASLVAVLASVCDAWAGPDFTVSVPDKKAEIDVLAAEYVSTVKTLSPEQRVAHLQRIQGAYTRCKEYSDDKVQLAMQTYEMVSSVAARATHRLGQNDASRGSTNRGRPSPGTATTSCFPCLSACVLGWGDRPFLSVASVF